MTVLPFQLQEVVHLYSRLSRLKPSSVLEPEVQGEPQDVVHISAEAKRRQGMDQSLTEAQQQMPKTR